MALELPTDAVFEDQDCIEILGMMLQTDDIELIHIDAWVRLIAYHYFQDPKALRDALDSPTPYHEQLGLSRDNLRCYQEVFRKHGLVRMCPHTGMYTTCRPSLFLSRSRTQEKISGIANRLNVTIRGGFTPLTTNKPVTRARKQSASTVQPELAFA